MAIRSEVIKLRAIAPLPSEDDATPEIVEPYEKLIRAITTPITDDEAYLLVEVFGDDGCFGLAASLVQRIETAPHWPILELLKNLQNPWIVELIRRAKRGGELNQGSGNGL
jgi:hypothetical protein